MQHSILGLEPGKLLARDACLVEATPHHLDVGGRVAMRGSDLRMAKPCLDGQQVHPGLQQRHRKRMSQDVRRDGLACQFRLVGGGRGDGSSHDVCRSKTRQALTMSADEERPLLVSFEAALAHERLQCFDQLLGNRHDPFFVPLAVQKHLRPCPIELKIARVGSERFGNTRTGTPRKKQQRSITTSAHGPLIRCVDKSVKLLPGEVMRHLGMRPLDRDREDALCDAKRGRVIGCHMVEE